MSIAQIIGIVRERLTQAAAFYEARPNAQWISGQVATELRMNLSEIERQLRALPPPPTEADTIERCAQFIEEQVFRIGGIQARDLAAGIRALAPPAPNPSTSAQEEPHG